MGPENRDFWYDQRPKTKVQSQSWDSESKARDPKNEI